MTTTMTDIPNTAASMPEITIYGPHECPNCDKAMKLFDRHDITYSKIDLQPGDENHRHVSENLGHQSAPVIVIEVEDGSVHWGGHRMDMLMTLVRLCTRGITTDEEALIR